MDPSIPKLIQRYDGDNSTFWGTEHTSDHPWTGLFLGLALPTSLMLLIALCLFNILVLRALLLKRKKSATNLVMVSMGIVDTGLCLTACPTMVISDLNLSLPFYYCMLLTTSVLSWAIASSFHHVVIAYYRWYIVAYPTRYKSSLTRTNIFFHTSLCWLGGLMATIIPYMGFNNYHNLQNISSSMNTSSVSEHHASWQQGSQGCSESPIKCYVPCLYQNVLSLAYLSYVIFGLCVLIPLSIIAVFYCLIFKALKAHSLKNSLSRGFYKKQKRVARITGLLFTFYIVSRLPFNLINLVLFFCPKCLFPSWVFPTSLFCAVFSAASNPLLYFTRNRELKKAMRQILKNWRRNTKVRHHHLSTVDQPGLISGIQSRSEHHHSELELKN